MPSYKILDRQIFQSGNFALVPIRWEDRYLVMKWRNEQIYHLRQNKVLTQHEQDKYFKEIINPLFGHDRPNQVLFSYLEGEKCIGYGGLVHINWTDKNAEISFVMDTSLEKEYFEFHWSTYLNLIELVAFENFELHKIFTYAFDLRPKLYTALIDNGFEQEAVLKEHCFFNKNFIDIVIHSKWHNERIFEN